MPFSGILRRVALATTDVPEEHIASIIRVTRIGELGTLAVISSVLQLLATANIVHSSLILLTVMKRR
jgi:hypothetical protein